MRIAMLSYHTCPLATLGGKDTGGMNVYVRELARQLGQMDIYIDVFTRSQDEHVPHISHDLGYGNRVVHVCAGPEIPLPKKELTSFIPEFVEGIFDFASSKGFKYDLVHSHYWMSGLAALSLRNEWDSPIIHMFHTLGLMKQRIARTEEEKEGEYRINGERKVIEFSDCIVAATPAEFAQLQWLYKANPRKIVIIPPGVDPYRFYPIPMDEAKEFIGIPVNDQMLLFVGRIEPLKGVDTLIQAMAILRDRSFFSDHPICLSVIGGDPGEENKNSNSEMDRLYELRQEYKVSDLITFLGKRSQDTLPYYYSAAEAVIVPSHYESFGMVALEAMACGTPVIASQVGGLAFLVQDGETGFTIPPDDPYALADKMMIVLRDADLRRNMGTRAAEFARQYAWEKIAARMVKLYDEVLSKHI
jgi:D-inositol-3-phosphate glycosyltransferase